MQFLRSGGSVGGGGGEAAWRAALTEAAEGLGACLEDMAEAWEILHVVAGGGSHPQQLRVHARLRNIYRMQGKWQKEAEQCEHMLAMINAGVEIPIERCEKGGWRTSVWRLSRCLEQVIRYGVLVGPRTFRHVLQQHGQY